MDASLFAKMLSDPSITDFKKLHYKYPSADMSEFFTLLKDTVYTQLPLPDFSGASLVYLENVTRIHMKSLKLLLAHQEGTFGLHAMEEEISSSMEIEGINTSRDSVRRILQGYAPQTDEESRIYGMKLDWILLPIPPTPSRRRTFIASIRLRLETTWTVTIVCWRTTDTATTPSISWESMWSTPGFHMTSFLNTCKPWFHLSRQILR